MFRVSGFGFRDPGFVLSSSRLIRGTVEGFKSLGVSGL